MILIKYLFVILASISLLQAGNESDTIFKNGFELQPNYFFDDFNGTGELTVYWQISNLDFPNQADDWILYKGTGQLPNAAPVYSESVYVGLITYAFYDAGVPFVGSCDSFEILEY